MRTLSQEDKEGEKGQGYNNPPDFPIDVFFHILSRVPAISVHNFRSVQKPWNDLICSDPSFIEAHFLQAKQDPGWIMEMSNPLKGRGMFDTYLMKLEDGEIIKQNINVSHHAIVTVLASCNGLLLMKKRSTLYLVNPITKQQMKLPSHGLRHGYDRYAFANIQSTRKYKVLYYYPGLSDGCRILTLGSNT
ncbi:putative F-box/kelch-repeat protein At1g62270 [Telopea speciosissima]|uniref:putative F-box/kelch-repeat protein At1g62270 n=1 Tax=Telopea speciosissima TaxID=54955 RepID=UPI001CC56354|nr:putative F-box/kelch-repeat protein At1g62270 [Telopea speciosissima]